MILQTGEDEFFTHVLLTLGKPVEPVEDGSLHQHPDGSFDHDSATRLTENIVEGIEFERKFAHVRKPWVARYERDVNGGWGSHDRYRAWVRGRAKTLG